MKLEVIAELAQGFEGSLEQAKLMVKAAAKAGADAAKFQLVFADELATPDYEYYKLFSKLEMSYDEWYSLKIYCDHFNIELIFDVFGKVGLSLAESIGVKSVKVHATDINNIGFLKELANSSIYRIMLGGGGAYAAEIKIAIDILYNKKIILFHGFQGYPTAIEENQISRIKVWKKTFAEYPELSFGFSDHVDPNSPLSIALPAFAIGQGAMILEKHLTLGACMELEDHESAMNPDQFKIFAENIRNISIAYGKSDSTNDFGMSKAEAQYRLNIRRHVVVTEDITSGHVIKPSDVVLKRTSNLNPHTDLQTVYNKTASRTLIKNTPINMEDIA